MRQVEYIKNELSRHRGRFVSVRERINDEETDTSVVKNFVYLVTRVGACPDKLPAPEIRLMKKIDTQANREGFVFKVKGVIYIKKEDSVFQIKYSHGLNIKIFWKTHVLSSDNPAAIA